MKNEPSDTADDQDVDPEEIESAATAGVTPEEAPEVDATTEKLTVWDEPPDATGGSAPKIPMEDETSVAEQLVDEGLDEADRDQRLASADPDFEP